MHNKEEPILLKSGHRKKLDQDSMYYNIHKIFISDEVILMDVYIRKPNEAQKKLLESCPTWEHRAETFEGKYDDREETCLIIEGNAFVETPDGIRHYFSKGDLVTFRPNLVCSWTITDKIKKYYIFNLDPKFK